MLPHSFLFLCVFACFQDAAPAERVDTESRARTIAPFLDDQTFAVVRVDVSRLNIDAVSDLLGKFARATNLETESIKPLVARHASAFLKAGGKEAYLVASVADLPGSVFLVVPVPPGADAKAIKDALAGPAVLGLAGQQQSRSFQGAGKADAVKSETLPWEMVEQVGQVIFAGSKSTLERVRKAKPAPRPEVAQAFAVAGDMTIQVLFVPTTEMRRIVEEMLPTVPYLGAVPSTVFTHGIQWAAIGVEASPTWAVRAVVQSRDAESAQALSSTMGKIAALGTAALALQGNAQLQKLELAKILKLQPAGNQLRWSLDAPQIQNIITALAPAIEQQDSRQRTMNNLRRFAIAAHNYYDQHNQFPAAANYDKAGKPLLSWRVHLLPYVDQEALYKEFHLDEPWDSDHNKKLIEKMPEIFRSPLSTKKDEVRTVYVAPLGEATMFPDKQPVQFKDITDGTANTILFVEVGENEAVIWTKPEDLKIDAKDPAKGLTRAHRGGFPVAFADGSVRLLPEKIDAKTLYALFTRNGGENVRAP